MELLIDPAVNFDIEALESIYHDDFQTTQIMSDSTVQTFNTQ